MWTVPENERPLTLDILYCNLLLDSHTCRTGALCYSARAHSPTHAHFAPTRRCFLAGSTRCARMRPAEAARPAKVALLLLLAVCGGTPTCSPNCGMVTSSVNVFWGGTQWTQPETVAYSYDPYPYTWTLSASLRTRTQVDTSAARVLTVDPRLRPA